MSRMSRRGFLKINMLYGSGGSGRGSFGRFGLVNALAQTAGL